MHCHFRLYDMLYKVASRTARYASRAIVMPNTDPRPILSAKDVLWYRGEILAALRNCEYPFDPLMTIAIRDNTTPRMVEEAYDAGAVAGKIYPLGVTTNSDKGLRDFFSSNILDTFTAMRERGMKLLIHGELDLDRTLVTNRESVFLPTFQKLVDLFPDLRIVLEHISTEESVHLIKSMGRNVAATITAHHLFLTLNDVIGYGIQPHNGCMPTPKDFSDRDALVEAATSGNPKFFLGSDSAPHPREKKECKRGGCGVYTAPVLPCVLAEVFEREGYLDRLEDFTSRFGAEFYNLPLNEGTIEVVKRPWRVPDEIEGVVPFRAGEILSWQVV